MTESRPITEAETRALLALFLRPLLGLDELAEMLRFPSERAAREWLSNARVPTVKIAGRLFVRHVSLMQRLEELEDVPADLPPAPNRPSGRGRGRSISELARKLGG